MHAPYAFWGPKDYIMLSITHCTSVVLKVKRQVVIAQDVTLPLFWEVVHMGDRIGKDLAA